MRVWFLILILTLSAACSQWPTRGVVSPLAYDPRAVAQADRIAIFLPGALSSVAIFDASRDWENHGYARVFYRYPGLDDLPLDHVIDVDAAAAEVARFANAYPDKPIALIGYSTGGPIALLAAPQITKDRDVAIAAIAPAVEYAGGLPTALRGLRDVLRAVARAETLTSEDIWAEYWAQLLYGPDAFGDPAFEDRLDEKIELGKTVRVRLDRDIMLAHAQGLINWMLPPSLDLQGTRVAFFIGLNDPVFSTAQTLDFARAIGGVTVYSYPDEGHLMFFTRPEIFEDLRRYLETGRP